MKSNREYVDLGLPSGLLWAKCNLGASKPEEPGLYFQWGDTKGYTDEQVGKGEGKKGFLPEFKDCVWWDNDNFTKYNKTDKKLVLDESDDPASVLLGCGWRMPTKSEIDELIFGTDIAVVLKNGDMVTDLYSRSVYERTEINLREKIDSFDVNGVQFMNKKDHSKFIFIPVTGFAVNGYCCNRMTMVCLWFSSLNVYDEKNAWEFLLDSNGGSVSCASRYHGMAIRPVKVYTKLRNEDNPEIEENLVEGIRKDQEDILISVYKREKPLVSILSDALLQDPSFKDVTLSMIEEFFNKHKELTEKDEIDLFFDKIKPLEGKAFSVNNSKSEYTKEMTYIRFPSKIEKIDIVRVRLLKENILYVKGEIIRLFTSITSSNANIDRKVAIYEKNYSIHDYKVDKMIEHWSEVSNDKFEGLKQAINNI